MTIYCFTLEQLYVSVLYFVYIFFHLLYFWIPLSFNYLLLCISNFITQLMVNKNNIALLHGTKISETLYLKECIINLFTI